MGVEPDRRATGLRPRAARRITSSPQMQAERRAGTARGPSARRRRLQQRCMRPACDSPRSRTDSRMVSQREEPPEHASEIAPGCAYGVQSALVPVPSIQRTSRSTSSYVGEGAWIDCASPLSASSESSHPVGALPAALAVGCTRRKHAGADEVDHGLAGIALDEVAGAGEIEQCRSRSSPALDLALVSQLARVIVELHHVQREGRTPWNSPARACGSRLRSGERRVAASRESSTARCSRGNHRPTCSSVARRSRSTGRAPTRPRRCSWRRSPAP